MRGREGLRTYLEQDHGGERGQGCCRWPFGTETRRQRPRPLDPDRDSYSPTSSRDQTRRRRIGSRHQPSLSFGSTDLYLCQVERVLCLPSPLSHPAADHPASRPETIQPIPSLLDRETLRTGARAQTHRELGCVSFQSLLTFAGVSPADLPLVPSTPARSFPVYPDL